MDAGVDVESELWCYITAQVTGFTVPRVTILGEVPPNFSKNYKIIYFKCGENLPKIRGLVKEERLRIIEVITSMVWPGGPP